MTSMRLRFVVVTFLLACAGCDDTTPRSPHLFEICLRVTSDTGKPVASAAVAIDGAPRGETGGDGLWSASLAADEGRRVALHVQCPSGYRAHERDLPVVLRSSASLTGETRRSLQLTTVCRPAQREGVLVVRTQGAARLPVVVDGEVLGHISDQGVAHIPLSLLPGTTLRVTIDTTAVARLRPQQPTQRFTLEDRDAVLVFDQAFAMQQVAPRRARSQAEALPYRIH